MGYSVWLSLHRRNRFTRADEFAGLASWVQAFNDPRFLDALRVTLEDTLVCLVIQVVLGMAIALLLDCERRGCGGLQALMTLSLVVPPAARVLMFRSYQFVSSSRWRIGRRHRAQHHRHGPVGVRGRSSSPVFFFFRTDPGRR